MPDKTKKNKTKKKRKVVGEPQVVRFSSLEVAQESLQKASENVERWEAQVAQRKLDLADAERTLGEEVVGNVDPDATVNKQSTDEAVTAAGDRIVGLRAALEAAEAAVLKAREHEDAARRATWRAEAGQFRAEGSRLRERAAKREQKTNKLREQLREFEHVEYVPKPPTLPAVPGETRFVPIPKTTALINQALGLEQRAIQLEQRAADTPQAREEKAAQQRRAHEEYLTSERERFRSELADDYHDLEKITANSRFMKPGPDDIREWEAYERAVSLRAQLRNERDNRHIGSGSWKKASA